MGFTLNQLEQERQIRKLQKKEDKDTKDYEQLSNLPKVNNVELKGNKTTGDLGINADNVMMSDGVTSVEDAVSRYHVIKSVTADGVKTYNNLINELFNGVSIATNADVIVKRGESRLYMDTNTSVLIDFSGITVGSTAMTMFNVLYNKEDSTKSSFTSAAVSQGSTTFSDYTNTVPTSGFKIELLKR